MAGITDCSFRSFMKKRGAGIVVTELISAHGIHYGNKRTQDLMKFEEIQRPIGIQLFGECPKSMADAARFSQDLGADFVDLNFGCPVPKVVKKGAGSAILKDLVAVTEMLKSIRSAIEIPLTIKIRTGWDETQRNADQVAHIAYNEGIAWVAIHGRTRAQGYSGKADWEYIREVKEKSKLPILGNGDIHSAEDALEKMKVSGCDGVLIGRGCLKDPWIFQKALALYQERSFTTPVWDFQSVFDDLKSELIKSCEEKVLMIQLKKFAAWYSTGYPGASQFRKNLFQAHSVESLQEVIGGYFDSLHGLNPLDTRNEPFLMGGHG